MHDEDTGIVEAVRGGDTEAYRLLVDRHRERVFAFVVRQLSDPVLADEITQDAFVKAYTALPRFRGESTFGTWLIQIALHTVRDHLRRKGRLWRQNVVSLEEYRESGAAAAEPVATHPDADPESAVRGRETRDLTQRALAELPDDYREIISLKHGEDLSYETIAEMTGDSVGTLKVRAHRARALLRRKLHDLGWDGPSEGLPLGEKERGHV